MSTTVRARISTEWSAPPRPRIDWLCLAGWFVMAVFDAAVYVGLVWLLLWWLA